MTMTDDCYLHALIQDRVQELCHWKAATSLCSQVQAMLKASEGPEGQAMLPTEAKYHEWKKQAHPEMPKTFKYVSALEISCILQACNFAFNKAGEKPLPTWPVPSEAFLSPCLIS